MTAAQHSIKPFSFDRRHVAAFIIAIAWLGLFLPVYLDFAGGAWAREENGHVPFIMAICLGLAWARLQSSTLNAASGREFIAGVVALAFGLGAYSLGRLGEIDLILSAAQPVLAMAIVVCFFGFAGVRQFWFPLFLSLYLIIWPGWAIDAATGPLKIFVSQMVSDGLFAFGLPVAHSGAVISAGSYELLIADACAGLNSLIALTSVGAVYLYAVKRQSLKVNLVVVAALAPIAIIANLARVIALVLITYYFGYDAGQSFLHEAAGLVMFAVALIGVFAVDALSARFWERSS